MQMHEKTRLYGPIFMALLMVFSGVTARELTPKELLAESVPIFELDKGIPYEFLDWKEDPAQQAIVLNPQTEEVLNSIYDKTLSRTYVNSKGQRIMLSIAYGSSQTDTLKAHTPDICYPAQGFTVNSRKQDVLDTPYGVVPVSRIKTSLGRRIEPVTYWIIVGDSVGVGSFERKLIQLRYGFSGVVPDGLLFRVSSIDDSEMAYDMHDHFIKDLLSVVGSEKRKRLSGLN